MEPAADDRPVTAEEYGRLPDDGRKHELLAGTLLSEPQPFPRHARIQAALAAALVTWARDTGAGVVLTDCGFLLSRAPDTIRAPDIAFVRRERYDPTDEDGAFFPGAPDLAVEILSPSNRPGDVHAKVADYLAAGSVLVWIVDPSKRGASVYRTLLSPRWVPLQGSLDGEDVLPGFSARLDTLL